MELTINRVRLCASYTLSRIFDERLRERVWLDLVEPPLAGLALSPVKTFDRGLYKLYLKPSPGEQSLVPTFQRVPARPRLTLRPLLVATAVKAVSFVEHQPHSVAMIAGRLDGETLLPDPELFDRFIMRLVIAKQQGEKLTVHIK